MPLPPVSFPTLGWQVIDWIEEYLVHGPGDVQGQPIVVDDEIALHICWLYRVWPQEHARAGRRLVQRGVLSRPKGRAKSEIAGMLSCAEALGPVRCDGFDAQGDPVGVPVTYPFVRCMATEEEQSGNTYDNVRFMLEHGRVADEYAIDTGLTRTFIREHTGGEIVPSTSGSASKDGGKETFAVADETHLYVTPQLRGMYGTVARNTGKRREAEPWMYDTTTAWLPGERSVAEQAFDRYGQLDVGEAVERHGVLWDHRQGDIPKRFGDDRSLAKALRSGYGPAAEWMDFDRIVKIIRDAEDPEADAFRYFLNRPRRAASHWLAPDELDGALCDLEIPDGVPVTLGFDGSQSDDHTTLWVCAQVDEQLVLQPVGIWAADPDLPDKEEWRVPADQVTQAVDWAFSTWTVIRLYGDPPYFQQEMAAWAARHGSPPVVEWWTNRDTPMAAACGNLRTGLRNGSVKLNPEQLRTDAPARQGKPVAVWHFENARTRKVRVKLEDRAEEAWIVRKERPGSPLKIDSVPAAALALEAHNDALAAGEFNRPVYSRASW